MARPAPDPERVLAVFEQRYLRHKSFRAIVEWSHHEWGEDEAISLGTAKAWADQGWQWWLEVERLTAEQEYGLHRSAIGMVLEALVEDREQPEGKRELTLREWVDSMAKMIDLHGKAAGIYARQIGTALGTQAPTISPEQRRATEALRRRVQGRVRGVIEG